MKNKDTILLENAYDQVRDNQTHQSEPANLVTLEWDRLNDKEEDIIDTHRAWHLICRELGLKEPGTEDSQGFELEGDLEDKTIDFISNLDYENKDKIRKWTVKDLISHYLTWLKQHNIQLPSI